MPTWGCNTALVLSNWVLWEYRYFLFKILRPVKIYRSRQWCPILQRLFSLAWQTDWYLPEGYYAKGIQCMDKCSRLILECVKVILVEWTMTHCTHCTMSQVNNMQWTSYKGVWILENLLSIFEINRSPVRNVFCILKFSFNEVIEVVAWLEPLAYDW